jgi:molybdate transport repressor ModE-like protein
MNASVQRDIGAAELALLLALARGGSLAAAAQLAGVDTSTVFRTVQRAEKSLGQRLFERSRQGYRATELGQRLAAHAERIEAELEGARSAVQAREAAVSGLVRISTTDTLLHGLLLPSLRACAPRTRSSGSRSTRATSSPTSRSARPTWRCAPPRGRRRTWWGATSGRSARRCSCRARSRRADRASWIWRRHGGSRSTRRCPSIRRCAGAASTCRAWSRCCA